MMNLPLAHLNCSQQQSQQIGSPLTAFSASSSSPLFQSPAQSLSFQLHPQFSSFSLNESPTHHHLQAHQQQQHSSMQQLDQDFLLSQINTLLLQKDKSQEQMMQQNLLIQTVLSQIQSQRNSQQSLLSSYTAVTANNTTNTTNPFNVYNNPMNFNQTSPQFSVSAPSVFLPLQFHQHDDNKAAISLNSSMLFPMISTPQTTYSLPRLDTLQSIQALNLSSEKTIDMNSKRSFERLQQQQPSTSFDNESEALLMKKRKLNSSNEKISNSQQARRNSTDKEDKDPRSRSRFHNLTKLFLNSLLSIFTRENMSKVDIAPNVQEDVIQCIARVKQSGRKTQGKVCKTDLFNHSHYNALFLKLTSESIRELSTKPKDAQIHKLCFDIDVMTVIPQSRIDHINEMKKAIFETTQFVLGNPIESESVRDEYWLRAIVGIKQLAEGKLIYRFQSITANEQQFRIAITLPQQGVVKSVPTSNNDKSVKLEQQYEGSSLCSSESSA